MAKVSNVRSGAGGAGGGGDEPLFPPQAQPAPMLQHHVAPTNANQHAFVDSQGRQVVIQRIRGAKRLRFLELVGANSENRSYVGIATLASSVISLNGEAILFPQTKMQLEALVERLDDGLLEEVGDAYGEAFPIKTAEEIEEAAKN